MFLKISKSTNFLTLTKFSLFTDCAERPVIWQFLLKFTTVISKINLLFDIFIPILNQFLTNFTVEVKTHKTVDTKLTLTGQNLSQVFHSRSERACLGHAITLITKTA